MTTRQHPEALHRRLGAGLAKRLGLGAILLLPLLITYWLLKFAFDKMDGLLQPAISFILGREVTGLSFAIIVVVLLLAGALASATVFRWVGRTIERGIVATPGIGSIYGTAKKLLPGSGPSEGGMGFDTVVRVEYPRRGAWAVGFLMSVIEDGDGVKYGVVYMPSTPMPQSGWLMQVPLNEIQAVDWSSGMAMQYIVSAGVTCPATIRVSPMQSPS